MSEGTFSLVAAHSYMYAYKCTSKHLKIRFVNLNLSYHINKY